VRVVSLLALVRSLALVEAVLLVDDV